MTIYNYSTQSLGVLLLRVHLSARSLGKSGRVFLGDVTAHGRVQDWPSRKRLRTRLTTIKKKQNLARLNSATPRAEPDFVFSREDKLCLNRAKHLNIMVTAWNSWSIFFSLVKLVVRERAPVYGHNWTHCTKLQIRGLHKMSVKKLTSSFPEFPLWATKLQGQLNTPLWKRVLTEQVLVGLFEVIREFIMLCHILKRLRFTFTPNAKREFVPRDQVSVRSDLTQSFQLVFTIFTFLTKQPWCNAVVFHFLSLHHFSHTFLKKWIDLFPSSVNTRPVFWKLSTPLEPKRIISVTW